ncbi:MAG: M14 family metallopeptidase [Cyclobacteriaceae bacterium]
MSFTELLSSHGYSCEPETKTTGFIPIEGTSVSMPFTLVRGATAGENLLLTGGVHGGEYPCIETVIRLARELKPETVRGNILLIHPVNTAAFLARMQYYGPYDGKNLNRVFPGKARGTVSERIAYVVNQYQQASDFYIDLHGGDIHESLVPFVIYSTMGTAEVNETSRKVSALLGFPYVVGAPAEGASIGGAAGSGVPGLLAELGQCGRWSESEVEEYLKAVRNVLRSFDSISGNVVQHEVQYLEKMVVGKATEDGCWYPSKQLKDTVTKGEKIGEIRDFFGEKKSEFFAEEAGRILYLVTSLAITADDPLYAVGVS